MSDLYYLCFSVNKLPDLTLTKYSVFDGSSVDNIMDKHGVFLRQLYRLGYTSGVYFHLLYYYNPDEKIQRGHHLSIIFYATAQDKTKLDGIREFLITSVLSNYYDFFCYEIAKNISVSEELMSDGSSITVLELENITGKKVKYRLDSNTKIEDVISAENDIENGKCTHAVCEIAPYDNVISDFNRMPVDDHGRIIPNRKFPCAAFLTKKDYSIPAQNRLSTDDAGEVLLYSIMEWEPAENGRLYNVLKLMEGYNQHAVLRIDIFPVEHTQAIRQRLPYAETRRRISDRNQGKDDNSENIIKSWDNYLNNLMKFPQFLVNVVAFADSMDNAIMLTDSVAAEAVESGTYLIENMFSAEGFDMYESDSRILHAKKDAGNYVAPFLSLYTLEEIRPMFSFPILYPGESIECQKETDPKLLPKEVYIDPKTNEKHESISLGISSLGYDVTFPLKLFKKHAFIAGVPGAGKTNTLLYLVTTLWRDTEQHIPFLVLEPAKQEYRALAMINGMDDLCVFSPGADTYFPLHINPFQFPVGLTLAEHIANLNAVFAGAFELIPPSPFLIDSCIEKVYLNKGWNINERNDGHKPYPTMQELYDSLKIAVEESGYEGESKANIRSVMEVRIGSLLRREIGNVYNVRESSMEPEEWLEKPVIIELEALGEGPANFMSLLISTLIREVLKTRKTSDLEVDSELPFKREINHIIFYEEAHNLIGPDTDDPIGGSVDPKISATKYLVKMLAEVRALGEGIVIADQLPTAMAPEVLKNTGLKIGHRITAQDDRNLLGSTMSASGDQLEEQGTFETGQALIFYEGLLKPFKMRVCEWEKGKSSDKYDSPSNVQLFEHLKNNTVYKTLLARSAKIMQEKMCTEFEAQRIKAYEFKKKTEEKNKEIKALKYDMRILSAKLEKQSESDGISETRKHLNALEKSCQKIYQEFRGPLYREIKKICWQYNNLYYSYITLSKNYAGFSDDMYISVIKNYLSLFEMMKSMSDTQNYSSVIIEETSKVMKDIKRFIDYTFVSDNALLCEHNEYKKTVSACVDYFTNVIRDESVRLKSFSEEKILCGKCDNETLVNYCKSFSDIFFKYLNLAEKHYSLFEELIVSIKEKTDKVYEIESAEKKKSLKQAELFTEKKTVIYKALVSLVLDFFEIFENTDSDMRAIILKNTQEVLDSFRTIVNYYDKSAKTILSDWKRYDEIWQATSSILIGEVCSRFRFANKELTNAVKKVEINKNDKTALSMFCKSCMWYSMFFNIYSKLRGRGDSYKLMLVNYYTNYLMTAYSVGETVYPIIAASSNKCWQDCANMIKELINNKVLDSKQEEYFNYVSNIIKPVLETKVTENTLNMYLKG